MASFWIFLVVIIHFTPASLATRDNMIGSFSNSWFYIEDAEAIIKLSYPYSRCCNIYLNSSQNVGGLFRQFLDAYPYEYVLQNRKFQCRGYMLLASEEYEIIAALEYAETAISSTEILVLIDSPLENESMLLNVSLYNNAKVNVVSPSGHWALSENYLSPRVFSKMTKFERMKQKSRNINLMGRELQVGCFYRPPASYLNTTVPKIINGNEILVYTNDTELDGIEVQMFLIMAQKLNFTFKLRAPTSFEKYGKKINDTVWEGGVIGMIRQNQLDLAFASIWQTTEHHQFVNLTKPWGQLFIHFLVPRPRSYMSFWALTRPFTLYVWILLVITILMQSLNIYVHAWFSPRIPERFRNFIIVLTETLGGLLGTPLSKNTSKVGLQMQFWYITGVVIVTAYSCSLAARLTNSHFEQRIDTIQQFLDAGLTWGRTGPIPPFKDYFDLEDAYESMLPKRYFTLNSGEEIHKYLSTGKYAVIGRIVSSIFFPEDWIRSEDLSKLRVMKQHVGKYYSSFAVQPWLLDPIDTLILLLNESGITYYHIRDVIRRRVGFHLRELTEEHDIRDGKARVLSMTPLGAGFLALMIGLSLSTVVFLFELRHAKHYEPIICCVCKEEKKMLVEVERVAVNTEKSLTTASLSRIPDVIYRKPSIITLPCDSLLQNYNVLKKQYD